METLCSMGSFIASALGAVVETNQRRAKCRIFCKSEKEQTDGTISLCNNSLVRGRSKHSLSDVKNMIKFATRHHVFVFLGYGIIPKQRSSVRKLIPLVNNGKQRKQ